MEHTVKSVGIVAGVSIFSRLLGFFRDALIASFFGASRSLDAFLIAFRIPNLFRRLAAEGVLSVSFVPVISGYRALKGNAEADRLTSKILTLCVILIAAITIPAIIFSDHIASFTAFGFIDPSLRDETAILTRILLPYIVLIIISSLFSGYLNSRSLFFAPTLSPVILNIAMITGAVLSVYFFDVSVRLLAYGMLAGGLLQCLVQIPSLLTCGFRFRISVDLKHPEVRRFFRSAVPFILAASVYQINVVINSIAASSLSEGSVSWLYYADRLTELSLSIFVYSMSNVLIPEFSELMAKGAKEDAGRFYNDTVRASIFIALPAAGALICAGFPIVSVLFMRGNFSADDAVMTSRALACSSIGLIPLALIRMQLPILFAEGKGRIALISAFVGCLLNVILGFFLIQTELKHAGLALANSIAVIAQCFILSLSARASGYRIGRSIIFWGIRIIIAASVTCVFVLGIISTVNWNTESAVLRITMLIGVVSAGVIIYFISCRLMRIIEARKIFKIVFSIIKKHD
jgi:putative peptidoglycan lipid II flippase